MPSSANVIRLGAPLRRAAFDAAEIARAAQQQAAEAAREEGYQKGFMDATAFMNQQLNEQRADVIQLMEKTFKSLGEQSEAMWQQLGAILPDLATEIARRVLSGLPPDRERIEASVREILCELSPGTRDVEITLHPSDMELLGRFEEEFTETYPGLRFIADSKLAVGDCRLRSSFGLVDATVAAKLDNISRSLR
jgi:flagellar biosynthesis/type III secretory pathway protein FliH